MLNLQVILRAELCVVTNAQSSINVDDLRGRILTDSGEFSPSESLRSDLFDKDNNSMKPTVPNSLNAAKLCF